MLRGRDTERAAVAALLKGARESRGGALVLRGLAGTGKSALLADAVEQAEGMRVLRTQGIESESPLAFAALHRLLHPVLASADRLPAPQAAALRAAFGQAEGEVDRFLVFLATLSLLSELAEQEPVLAVVDDAHWLDEASAAALMFVARRLQAERIAMLFGARDADLRGFDHADLPTLTVGGLDADAAGALLADLAGVSVPAGVRDRLLQSTAGNALALVELAGTLPAEQLAGRSLLPALLPLTEGVERAFLDRYRRLPEDAQRFLLVAATDDSGRFAVVRQAATPLGATDTAVAAAERSGLLHVAGPSVELRHPLVRSAIYGAATSIERRAAHRALADALTSGEDADRRAWHRAAAAEEPDESVVAELDAAAERANRRGGLEAAAAAWERAAELSRDEEPRAQRLYAASRALWLAGQPARARLLADTALRTASEPGLKADVARLRARIEWNTGSMQRGHRMVLEAAREVAGYDPDRAREMAMFAAALAAFGGDSGVDIDPVDFAAREQARSPRTQCFADLLVGLDHAAAGRWKEATPLLRAAFALTDELDEADQDLLPNFGIAALHLGDASASQRYHDRLLHRARDTGAMVMVLYALTRRGFSDVATGQWATAASGSAEALVLADSTGQPGLAAFPMTWLALLDVLRGEEAFDDHLARAEHLAGAYPTGIVACVIQDLLQWARGLRAADATAAMYHYEQIANGIVRRMAGIDRLEAAVRAGRLDLGREWTAELDEFAGATNQRWAAALAGHGKALLAAAAEDPTADELFRSTLDHHAAAGRPFDRARTHLAYGQYLRRSRRRVDSRDQLRRALQMFEDLGARPWADRAATELRASGQTARRRDDAARSDLTPQELQVARLIKQGKSNRDAAAQLFLSPRTIDFHLRNVFAKVGVSSRAELAQVRLE